ncbi:TIGR03621 family F420-dependent LLM class oxidoreductase [Streptomyces sp. NPDC050161]|uniref:TIGR03621 family F420-dependent LLM class oxidoreductase n=1 Tax=Streptomyces sp. NPDC050161 TaxID=3365604 RepID=UPI0037AADA8C
MRKFRFGVNLNSATGHQEWTEKCRAAESLGYDVLTVPDHLGVQAPFPALVAAAAVTEHIRVATFVLNSAFWNPVLLAREVRTTDRLTDRRLEVGLGTGYVRSEFDKAGVSWGTAGTRVDRLEETVTEVTRLLDNPRELGDTQPPSRPPLVIGGNGNRVLGLAARHADVVAFTGAVLKRGATRGTLELLDGETVAERVAHFASAAGERGAQIERNILVQAVSVTPRRDEAVEALRRRMPHLTAAQIADTPTVLLGSVKEITDQLRERRDRYGFSYISVHESAMTEFAQVVESLAGE